MNRNKFLNISSLAGMGLITIPHISFNYTFADYTRNQLLGKGNPDIQGSSYTETMHKETKVALDKMSEAAQKEGIDIEVISAYRSFQRQKEIFEGKYTRYIAQGSTPEKALDKIIEYSTIPGTSRHHWGTDIDIIQANVSRPSSVLQPQHFHGKGAFCKLKEWLDTNANQYGFFEVYTDNANRKGFKYEPWHFSYAPVSKPMLSAYRKLDLKEILMEERIKGNEYFTEAFLERYWNENILDINPKLLS